MTFNVTYKPFGERAILIEWPPKIDEMILKDIIRFKTAIIKNNIESIVELKSAYNSLLIVYDTICRNFENEVNLLKNIYKSPNLKHVILSKLWKIPVCYDADFGIDLDTISAENKLSKTEIIQRHSQAVYTVYFIGFLPGFLYLGGLDDSLHVPRKSTPRLKIEKGAVAIGGHQTGVYPIESPGGWNIIGNSPIMFFNPKSNPPCFAKAGDKISFYPISINEYNDIKMLSTAEVYQLESEVIDD
ncbi:5-oxoprolinase subunit PxpB [Confluentibacter flavum]|uniref:Allophanate hydrolase subunit 1 n=1 Tax=Confluentibacter flavum TaxID=1909700 RepID=A0A2N3HMN5_9FLAO|nr:5-oxoprolinase subunit PxpB [Confluentibacter flavum]PKQ46240.1 allophanate hydrolase subunit 1 [Confluentibacter flavum]